MKGGRGIITLACRRAAFSTLRSLAFQRREELSEPAAIKGAKWIPLTRGRFALVDKDLFEALNEALWHWNAGGRSAGHVIDSRGNLLHHVVLGIDNSVHIDHRNNNGLDCRRKNLRPADKSKNGANRGKFIGRPGRKFTSKYKGVVDRSRHYTRIFVRNIKVKSIDKPWLARIRVNRKLISIGRFATEAEAAHAYDAAALQHFGEFARLNFPTSQPGAVE